MTGRIARHNEVISPIGVALALVREQVERIVPGATQEQILAVRAEAERAVVEQGAAADGVEVEVTVDPQTNVVRAIATGATELRTQDRAHRADDAERLRLAATSLKTDPRRCTSSRAPPRTPSTAPRSTAASARPPPGARRPAGSSPPRTRRGRGDTVAAAQVLAKLVAEYLLRRRRRPRPRRAAAARLPHRRPLRRPGPAAAARAGPQRTALYRAADEPVVAVLEVRE
ncbi:hypothetical protein SVIOM342S_04794 [Streptomyces violaceorubidus]